MEQAIITNISDSGIATIRLNRPDVHNAFNDETIASLTNAIENLNHDEQIKVICVAANGKSFCAGADLNWMRSMADYDFEQNYTDSVALANLMHKLYHSIKPTIAICQGAAFGGGVGLLACCDVVIASDNAVFCLSEVKLGLIPAVISPFVVKALGERQARRYFISAEKFDCSTARQLGLVHLQCSADALIETAEKYCQALLANGPVAMCEAKRLVNEVAHQTIDEKILAHTANRIATIRASAEGKEGISAFLQRRAPNWQSDSQQ